MAANTNINTVTPNSTEIRGTGATALNLSVGANGTGMLVIQNGGTLTDIGGFIGNLPGGIGTVIVSGAGSRWTNVGTLVVGGLGTGSLTIQNGGVVNSGGGGSVDSRLWYSHSDRSGLHWNNSPVSPGGLNIGSFGTGSLTITNGGRSIITPPSPPTSARCGLLGTVRVTIRAPLGATVWG